MLVDVALPLPIPQTFTYRLEGASPAQGTRVRVVFSNRRLVGWITGPARSGTNLKRVRPVSEVLDAVPSVPPELFRLCRWVADYYVAPLGLVLRSALPAAFSDAARPGPLDKTRRVLRLTRELPSLRQREELFGRAARQRECYELLEGMGAAAEVTHLVEHLGFSRSVLKGLVTRGVAAFEDERVDRDPFAAIAQGDAQQHTLTAAQQTARDALVQAARGAVFGAAPADGALGATPSDGAFGATPSDSALRALPSDGGSRAAPSGSSLELARGDNLAGEHALVRAGSNEASLAAASRADPRPFLLYGVTGSGKTLVYIELLREVVSRQGRSAIVLVPEIALTPQTVARFRAHFGQTVAVLHSALSDGERYDAWRALRCGERRIAIGARSAVFAPVENLGAVILDEEHEGTYKQSEAPRYHAREVAIVRARMAGAVCLLGSATPSLESWNNAQRGKFRLLELPERVEGRPLPPVKVVDLRKRSESGDHILSTPLAAAMRDRLERGEQTILLLNRRGFSTFVQCRDCGVVWQCPQCNVSLTYHRGRRRLVCHYCFHEAAPPVACDRCGSGDLSFRGIGTEQVEQAVSEAFPGARIARMDVDTTSGKWAHHQILERVERGDIDILLGTQMIAKGLDFPRVTLVGVVNADVSMSLPDFRAGERTFQLLTQVAGRAGRGSLGGGVLVQTALPGHYAVTAATAHDYVGFAGRELEARTDPLYPPYCRLANIVVSGTDEDAVCQAADAAAEWTRRLIHEEHVAGIEILGPAPCPIDRIRGRWRWRFLLRSTGARRLGRACTALHQRHVLRPGKADLRLIIDRDPVALL